MNLHAMLAARAAAGATGARRPDRRRKIRLDSDGHVDVVIEAIEAKKSIVMVNVEADALGRACLARKAREAGVIYSQGLPCIRYCENSLMV